MKIIGLIYIISIFFLSIFFILGYIIEKNFDEDHKVKKWWRKHVVGHAPDNIDL